MADIQTVTLRKYETVETENGFENQLVSEQRFPASITNHSLYMGEKLGLIESNKVTDLSDLNALFESALNPKADMQDMKNALNQVDQIKYLKVIYLAIIGMNPDLNLTFDEFTQLYHENIADTIELYSNLVASLLNERANNFVEGLKKSTKKKHPVK